MGRWFASRRAADEFERAVTEPGATRDPAYDELMDLVAALRDVPQPTPRPEFSASLREQLMAEADTVLAVRERTRRDADERLTLAPVRPRTRRLGLAMGGLAFVGSAATVGIVAQAAVPGDLLYPLKRGLESSWVAFTVGDRASGEQLLAQATERLHEAAELTSRTDPHPEDVSTAFHDFTDQAVRGSDDLLTAYEKDGDPAAVAKVKAFTAASLATLADLSSDVPVASRDEFDAAVEALLGIDERAKTACPACGGPGIVEIPTVLAGAFDLDSTVPVTVPTKVKGTPKKDPTTTVPTTAPTRAVTPTQAPTQTPTAGPTSATTALPSDLPTTLPTTKATVSVKVSVPTSALPTVLPTEITSILPTILPTLSVPTVSVPTLPVASVSLPAVTASLPVVGTLGVTLP